MATVRTEAGKRLLANETMNARSFALITTDAIAAIEAEAVAAERARLAEAVRGLWVPTPGKWVDRAAVLALLEPGR